REAAARAEEEKAASEALANAERAANEHILLADRAERAGQGSRVLYEAAGAARAHIDARREWVKHQESKRLEREGVARDLRRQIEELRAQLARYAEALEEDLASGREKVAARAREGFAYERAYQDASSVLVSHLKGRPECRDLLNELTSSNAGANNAQPEVSVARSHAASL
ncbi:MAG TPA: hypothetical protein VF989_03855, partial [Polyangiaceae bacterium]